MNIKSTVGNTCLWCIVVAMAALTFLMVTWTAILVSS